MPLVFSKREIGEPFCGVWSCLTRVRSGERRVLRQRPDGMYETVDGANEAWGTGDVQPPPGKEARRGRSFCLVLPGIAWYRLVTIVWHFIGGAGPPKWDATVSRLRHLTKKIERAKSEREERKSRRRPACCFAYL